MTKSVTIKFKKPRDYSNENKDKIISALPGPYKVSRDALDDMNKSGTHEFNFKNVEVASKFAMEIFSNENSIFDVETNFTVK